MFYHCFTDVGIWASLGKAGITKIAYNFRRDPTAAQLCSCRQRINWRAPQGVEQSRDCKNRIRLQERSYDCTIMQLQTKDQLMMDNAGIEKLRTTLGEIVGLHNCAVA